MSRVHVNENTDPLDRLIHIVIDATEEWGGSISDRERADVMRQAIATAEYRALRRGRSS